MTKRREQHRSPCHMKYILSIHFVFLFMVLLAQEPPAFGDVKLNDFSRTPLDSIYSSIILFDKGRYVGNSYTPMIERHVRVKINHKDAFSLWADFKLGNDFARATKVKAATYYLEDGKIISHVVEKDAILKDVKSHNQKIVSLTNLREGCIIELSYRAETAYLRMPMWLIQDEVPVLWSEYLLLSPGKLTYIVRGPFEPFIYDSNYKGQSRWVFKNIPPFEPEPLMPDPVNYFARIEFMNPAKSWEALREDYLRQYEDWETAFEGPLKRKVKALSDSVTDPLEKIKNVCRYIKENYKWNGHFDYMSDNLSSVFEQKKGTSGDLNTILFSMLKSSGLEPNFILLSTPENGIILKTIPAKSQFNHVICVVTVNGVRYFLDATNPTLPFNIMPSYCIGSDGFVISKEGSSWLTLTSAVKEKIRVSAWLSISENEMLVGKVTTLHEGYGGFDEREKYDAIGEADYKKENIPHTFWNMDSAKISNMENVGLPVSSTYYGSLAGHVTDAETKIYVNPYSFLIASKTVLKETNRIFPVDLKRSIETTMTLNLAVPPGYKVESLPKSQSISVPDKTLTASFKNVSDDKNVLIVFFMENKKTLFESQEYPHLREFFDFIASKQNEMIVFAKE